MKKTLLATAIILALAATPTVFAKGKPTVELGNNLSFATLFVPDTVGAPVLRLPTVSVPTFPSGPECTLFPGYWCQKTLAIWQAEWATASTATVAAAWGANLLGDAPLKAGKPIRVEMGLTQSIDPAKSGVGYVVTKLTPELDDRLATYGTNGATQSTSFVVWDAGAELLVAKCADPACLATTGNPIFDDPMSAEINSLGKVVYGFNWGTGGKAGAAEPGTYRLTFTTINTSITTTNGQVCGPKCTYVIIDVTQSAGGGGGGGGPPNRP